MIERLMVWAGVHRNACLVAAGLAGAFGAGWLAHCPPPAPAVALKAETTLQTSSSESISTTAEKGPSVTTIDETLYDPPTVSLPTNPEECHPIRLIAVPMPGPVREVRHTVIETGPEVVRTQTVERVQEQERQQVSLTVSAQPSPRWALGASIEDPLGAKRLQLGIGFRLIGPVWLRAAFTPSRGAPGAALGAEVHF